MSVIWNKEIVELKIPETFENPCLKSIDAKILIVFKIRKEMH